MSEHQPSGFGPARPLGDDDAARTLQSQARPQSPVDPMSSPFEARPGDGRNRLAVAALAVVLVLTPAVLFATKNPGLIIPLALLGVVVAQMAASEAKRKGGIGKKTSTIALALNFVMIPVWIVMPFAVSGDARAGEVGDVALHELRVGDCVQSPEGMGEGYGDLASDTITRTRCNDKHWGQVYFDTRLDGGQYPGDDEVATMAEDACYSDEAMKAITPDKREQVWPALVFPSRETWAHYDRRVICFATPYDEGELSESWVVAE